jgi:hypothetical protein
MVNIILYRIHGRIYLKNITKKSINYKIKRITKRKKKNKFK